MIRLNKQKEMGKALMPSSPPPVTAYTLMGQKVAADSNAYNLYDKLHKGIYILKDSKGKTKKVIKK